MTDRPDMRDEDTTAPFGFRAVPRGEKAGMVRAVFDAVAPRYDLMNDLMSGGVHRLWKTAMVDWLDPRPGRRYLDVAGGTGDIATRILDRVAARGGSAFHSESPVIVCDINAAMLSAGRDRAIDRGRLDGLTWVCGNAEALPLPDDAVDAYTIAFGLRNVTDIDAALAEARRVLAPGGRFLCLEFSRVVLPVLDRLYDAYSFTVLPKLGQMVAGDGDAYRYLVESIRTFPEQAALEDRMRAAGFAVVSHRNLSGGIAALHSGRRI